MYISEQNIYKFIVLEESNRYVVIWRDCASRIASRCNGVNVNNFKNERCNIFPLIQFIGIDDLLS